MKPDFRARLIAGETLAGTLLTLPSPDLAEIAAQAGFDWLFIDGEHGAIGAREFVSLMRAAGDVPCLVRIPPGADGAAAHALDAGAAGIIVPQVHTRADAARAVQVAHYPPAGIRGVGPGRASGYGATAAQYLVDAATCTAVVVQAESRAALENIDAIARVPGVDAVLVGPHDLAASLGHLGAPDHPEVQAAIRTIVDTARAAGTMAGVFGVSAALVRPWADAGATLLVAGVDALLYGQAARALRMELAAPE